MREKNMLSKADGIVSESEIVTNDTTGETGKKIEKPRDLEKSIKTKRLSVGARHLARRHSIKFFLKKV